MFDEFGWYAACGLVAGFCSGLFGIGGGVVVVPVLAWLLPGRGVAAESIMIVAVATSLASIIVTSLSSIWAHQRKRAIHWPTVGRLAPGIVFGSVIGSCVAARLPAMTLKWVFGAFLLYVGARLIAGAARPPDAARHWGRGAMGIAGVGIGVASGILGIGGGTLSTPLLVRLGFNIRAAVAASAACGFPIAVAGSLADVWLGWNAPLLPTASLGYVYLPAVLGITLTSVPTAPLGAELAHRLPTAGLKRLFGGTILLIGLKLIWEGSARDGWSAVMAAIGGN